MNKDERITSGELHGLFVQADLEDMAEQLNMAEAISSVLLDALATFFEQQPEALNVSVVTLILGITGFMLRTQEMLFRLKEADSGKEDDSSPQA